jgi:hypothetical protein
MANVVSTVTLYNEPKYLVIKLLGLLDTGNETNVAKVDKSAYTGVSGTEPSYFRIMKIAYSTNALSVYLSVDATADVVLARIGGTAATSGVLDYSATGGISTSAAGDTGDILLTTLGTVATTAHYDVTLWLQKIGSV